MNKAPSNDSLAEKNVVNIEKFVRHNKYVWVLIGLVVVVLVSLIRNPVKEESTQKTAFFKVKEGPLLINVAESGVVNAREQEILRSELEGVTTILWIKDEGSLVKKGDLLVELDASKLEGRLVDQEIRVRNAEAGFINARENLDVVNNQGRSDLDEADLKARFAKQDLQKYLEGDYPKELKEARNRITVAEEEMRRAEEKRDWSKVLFAEKYLSESEYEGDVLAAQKTRLDLELAQSNLELLKTYTYTRKRAELESEVKQSELALERVKRKARANNVQADADLRAKESEFKREKEKLAKIQQQLEKTKIHAPTEGLVIYSTTAKGSWRGNDEPLAAGQEVKERQEIIYLPRASQMQAEVKIHESSLDKVKVGLPTTITVDSRPGKVYHGKVASISPLPDATSMWFNSDLKLYTTIIHIDGDGSDLRTGMSCRAEILVKKFAKALFVPVQAVVERDGKKVVYVGPNVKRREVEIGLDNDIMVRITGGLEEGDLVSITPPLAGDRAN